MSDAKTRCGWCGDDPLYCAYHDEEWGAPLRDERRLFEMLCLEGAQAGLSWLTILKKRAHYRKVFDNFDADKIARYDDAKIAALLADPGIVRNRLKVRAFITNARTVLTMREDGVALSAYLWDFVDGQPLQPHRQTADEIPPSTPLSKHLSAQLRKKGFTFVGETICYALMQSIGMVNDHLVDCYRHRQLLR